MTRRILLLLALVVAVPAAVCHLLASPAGSTYGWWKPQWIPLATVAVVGLLARMRSINQPVSLVLERLRHPLPRTLRWATLIVWLISVAYLAFTAFHQHRDLFPRLHDEHSYLIQSRMLAAGRLWEPQHPLADFFDTFYMLSRPVYAPIYFPGTALANAPFVYFGLPYWTMPLLVAGLIVAMTFNIVTRLIDRIGGLTSAVMVISTWGLRDFSTMVMAHGPMTLLGLLIFWAWLNWRKHQRLPWAAMLGVFIGWAIITRPVDALALAAPVLAATAWDLRGKSLRLKFATAMLLVAAVVPFITLQLALNLGTTGSLWKTPYTAYLIQDQPGSAYGYHLLNPSAHPMSSLPQKAQYIQQFRIEEIRAHTLTNIPRDLVTRAGWTVVSTLPTGTLWTLGLLLLPALFGLKDRKRLVFWSSLPLFLLLYLPNPFFLAHYPVPFTPLMGFTIALAVDVLARLGSRTGPSVHASTFLTAIVLAVCISSLPEFRPDVRDGTIPAMPLSKLAHDQLARATTAPAVVLFRYSPTDNPVEEPVYNDDVLWPDDAPIIRAHDLGPRNLEIASYYAARQPSRKFYLLDRHENVGRQTLFLHFLGTAEEYAHQLEGAPRETNP